MKQLAIEVSPPVNMVNDSWYKIIRLGNRVSHREKNKVTIVNKSRAQMDRQLDQKKSNLGT